MFGYTPYDRNLCISIPYENDWDTPDFDSRKLTLEEFFKFHAIKEKLCYVYDFGEDRIHDITLEKTIEGESERAACIAGKSNWSEEEISDYDDDEDEDNDGDEIPERPSPEGFVLEEVDGWVKTVYSTVKKNKPKGKRKKTQSGRGVVKHILFPARWMKRQPYSQQSDVDVYYIGIANKVLEVLDSVEEELASVGIDRERREKMAMALTMWFEDVVSDGGIWKAFTNECKKRYGFRLPFYTIDEREYYEDEVNLVDVKFLLWHYLQYMHEKGSVINAENPFIAVLADNVYSIFDAEFENAPINDEWHDALHPDAFAEPLLFSYREYLYKLMDCNYLYLHLFESIQEYIEEIVNDKIIRENAQEMMHEYVTGGLFDGEENFLGMSMSQWGTEIIRLENEALAKRLDTLKTIKLRLYSLVGEDKKYFHLVDYGDRNDKEGGFVYKMLKDSFGIIPADEYKVGETLILCRLTCCEGEWNLNGSTFEFSCDEMERFPDNDQQYTRSKNAGKEVYERFMHENGGKPFFFPRDRKEAIAFYKKCLGAGFEDKHFQIEGDDFVIYASPVYGIGLTFGMRADLKSADNPFYDKEYAKKNASELLCSESIIPYEVACKMYDMGMLDDAALNSFEGYEHGRQFLQRNAQFFMDYFLHGKRDNLQ